MSPTRELARQTHTVVLSLGDYLGVNAYLVVGGERVIDMKKQLQSGVHVVVGELCPFMNVLLLQELI